MFASEFTSALSSFSKNLAESVYPEPPFSISNHPQYLTQVFIFPLPQLMSHHPGLSSARILLCFFSQKSLLNPDVSSYGFSIHGPPFCSFALNSHFSFMYSEFSPVSLPTAKPQWSIGVPIPIGTVYITVLTSVKNESFFFNTFSFS